MTKMRQIMKAKKAGLSKLLRPRNYVVKNDYNRASKHRDRTQYQRHSRHKNQELLCQ